MSKTEPQHKVEDDRTKLIVFQQTFDRLLATTDAGMFSEEEFEEARKDFNSAAREMRSLIKQLREES